MFESEGKDSDLHSESILAIDISGIIGRQIVWRRTGISI